MTPMKKKEWVWTTKVTLLIFIVVSVIAFAVTAVILSVSDKSEKKIHLDTARFTVNIQAKNLGLDIQQVSSELAILANQQEFLDLWDDDGRLVSERAEELTAEFLYVVTYRRLYHQVRFLDENGMEIIRVNFNNGHPVVVPEGELQNKKKRYYFNDAFKLNRGQVFVSPLDLNIEKGEIEVPLNPVIRFATPVVDRHGKKRGVMIFNYFAGKMIEHFSNQAGRLKGNQAMLLNADGFWLHGPNPDNEWGFMYKDREQKTFMNSCPEAWKRIGSEDSCQFELPQGQFTSMTVYPLLEGQKSSTGSGRAFAPSAGQLDERSYHWKVVSFTPSDILYASQRHRRIVAAQVLGVLMLLFLSGSLWVARASFLRKQAREELIQKEKMKAVLEMAGAVCHEFNQPLQVITGYCELLKENDKINDETSMAIDAMTKETVKMAALTRKLMSITKYETKPYLEAKIIDIAAASEKPLP